MTLLWSSIYLPEIKIIHLFGSSVCFRNSFRGVGTFQTKELGVEKYIGNYGSAFISGNSICHAFGKYFGYRECFREFKFFGSKSQVYQRQRHTNAIIRHRYNVLNFIQSYFRDVYSSKRTM